MAIKALAQVLAAQKEYRRGGGKLVGIMQRARRRAVAAATLHTLLDTDFAEALHGGHHSEAEIGSKEYGGNHDGSASCQKGLPHGLC